MIIVCPQLNSRPEDASKKTDLEESLYSVMDKIVETLGPSKSTYVPTKLMKDMVQAFSKDMMRTIETHSPK